MGKAQAISRKSSKFPEDEDKLFHDFMKMLEDEMEPPVNERLLRRRKRNTQDEIESPKNERLLRRHKRNLHRFNNMMRKPRSPTAMIRSLGLAGLLISLISQPAVQKTIIALAAAKRKQ